MNKEKENKNAEISARIAEILQYTGETRNCFATKLGYERAQTIYDILNMKSAPSYDFFRRFSISEYSDIIELKWLLSGKGPMLHNGLLEERMPANATTSPEQESIIYKLYKEKDAEVGQLKEEIGALKLKLSQYDSDEEQIHSKGLGTAKDASTKKSSSPNADNVTSATAR